MNETSTVATTTTGGPGRSGPGPTGPGDGPGMGEQAGAVASTAAGQAREVAERARSEAGEVARRATDQVRTTADDQTRHLAEVLGGAASELRAMAQRSDRPDGTIASLARDGADRIEAMVRTLDDGGLDGVMDRAQRFARNRPGPFLAGCFAAGLLVGRFVRNDEGGAMRAAGSGTDDAARRTNGHAASGIGSTSGPASGGADLRTTVGGAGSTGLPDAELVASALSGAGADVGSPSPSASRPTAPTGSPTGGRTPR